jgi:hypothetical protein
MKINFGVTGILTAFVVLLASPVAGQIQVLNSSQIRVLTSNQVARVVNELNEVDFETAAANDTNTIMLGGVTFTDPWSISFGVCTSPTCQPDPDNATGQNITLFLNRGATISFAQARRIVVLDLQGNDTDRIAFRVTDARGGKRTVVIRAPEFRPTMVGLSSAAGIRRIEILRARDAGPISLARVLFSDPTPRHQPVPNGPPRRRLAR